MIRNGCSQITQYYVWINNIWKYIIYKNIRMASDSSWLCLEWLVILVYIVSNGLFQKKSKQEGVEDTFLNSTVEFFIFYFTTGNSKTKNKDT